MPTPSEGRALLFVAAVAALGLAVRGCRALRAPEAPASDREALARQIAVVDSALTNGGRRRTPATAGSVQIASGPGAAPESPPTAPAGPIDLDRASAAELDALPGIGPALAARIVADREANGAFGSLEALQEVRGIGPVLAARLEPLVTFSSPPRAPRPEARPGAKMRP